MLAQLERTGEDQISLTDPDSRAMAAHTRVAVGYNVQIAVDTKHKLIVEQQVTNQVVDMGLLTQTAEPAKEVLGVETIDGRGRQGLFQDRGYRGLREGRDRPYVPRPSAVLRSRRVCSARMSSNMTQPATATFAPRVSGFIPIHLPFCAA